MTSAGLSPEAKPQPQTGGLPKKQGRRDADPPSKLWNVDAALPSRSYQRIVPAGFPASSQVLVGPQGAVGSHSKSA
jgi:hypothetical protein